MTEQLGHDEGYRALRGGGAFVRLARDVVRVVGPDAHTFLQSLVSQDLDGVAVGATRHALLLQPQGKLTADFLAVRVADDAWHLVGVPGVGAVLEAGLARFKIRVKAELSLDAAQPALALRGAAATAAAAALGEQARLHPGVVVAQADWPGSPGVELVGDPAALDAVTAAVIGAARLPEAPRSAYEALRIECGTPEQGSDLDETIIAQEAGLDATAVSFTKGCFVGQELVCRIDSRGHVNRLLRGIVVGAGPEPAPGDAITVGGTAVGAITSVGRSPEHGVVALGLVRREVAPPASCEVGGASGEVRALPL